MALNKVMLIGNVGNDPEIRYLDSNPQSPQGNAKVASFRLATTERYRDRNGETRGSSSKENSVPVNGRTRPATSASPPKSRPTTSSSSASVPTPRRAVRAATRAATPAKASRAKAPKAATLPQALPSPPLPPTPPSPRNPSTRLPAPPLPPPTPRTTTCRSRSSLR